MTNRLEDVKINVKLKLSVLWITVNILFIYVDIYGYLVPGFLEAVMAGQAGSTGIQITQAWLLGVIILMTIPSLMVFLPVILEAKVNRWVNIIVSIFEIVFVLSSLFLGVPEPFYIFGSIVEVVLLALIVWYAWTWPTQEG